MDNTITISDKRYIKAETITVNGEIYVRDDTGQIPSDEEIEETYGYCY